MKKNKYIFILAALLFSLLCFLREVQMADIF